MDFSNTSSSMAAQLFINSEWRRNGKPSLLCALKSSQQSGMLQCIRFGCDVWGLWVICGFSVFSLEKKWGSSSALSAQETGCWWEHGDGSSLKCLLQLLVLSWNHFHSFASVNVVLALIRWIKKMGRERSRRLHKREVFAILIPLFIPAFFFVCYVANFS